MYFFPLLVVHAVIGVFLNVGPLYVVSSFWGFVLVGSFLNAHLRLSTSRIDADDVFRILCMPGIMWVAYWITTSSVVRVWLVR